WALAGVVWSMGSHNLLRCALLPKEMRHEGGVTMAAFVLVHGASHGGWCWKKIAPPLRAPGQEVYAATLTGLGGRAHLLSREVGLDTHIEDIINVLVYEELSTVVLVGHSYGGMVITGVAERMPERVRHLVYLDALVPTGEERSVRACFERHNPGLWR